jgi:uncharacterized protein
MRWFSKALVTGATSGIGEAMANLLAAKAIPLVLTGRNAEKLASLQKKMSAEVYPLELEKKESREQLGELVKLRKIDLVINNAGFGLYGEATSLPIEKQLEMVEVNCQAVLDLTLRAAKAMKDEGRRGVILNVSSAAAFQVFPNLAVYAATKAFLNSLSQSLDFELKDKGIRVLASCPGQVATDFSNRAAGRQVKGRSRFLDMTPEEAALALWEQIEKEERVHIFNWKYRFGTFLSGLLPTSVVAPLLQRIIAKR